MSSSSSQQNSINIRTANITDAQAVANIHLAAWRAAYIDIVSQTYLDNLCTDDRVKLWQRVLSDRDTAGSILVAAEESLQSTPRRLLGFVSFGPAMPSAGPRHEASDKEDKLAELRAIYIDPEYWARGIGQALWKAAQQQLMQEEKFTSVVVRVFARNERAIRFYRAAGFDREEKGVTEVGGKKLETLMLRKGLV